MAQTKKEPAQASDKSTGAMPDNTDLVSRIHFSPDDGHIWLDDQRMLLWHASGFGVLRHELIESLGTERARGLLSRMGYNSGTHDAELARRLRKGSEPVDTVLVGPQLHMLEGIGTVTPVRTHVDEENGQFYGEYLWHGSAEAEEHIRLYGLEAEPVCWMQIGYASGFTSRYMGRPILFKEVQCKAQGADCCRIVGKPAEEWSDAETELNSLRADQLTDGVAASSAPLLGSDDVVGVSAGFNSVCHKLRRVANTQATVLFLGESGVGKEVLARSLHRISKRSEGPFVAINCAAIPESLIESELFGVERGAFTGASHSRPGRFERASGGTLFLDEIGILSATSQGKLLRALQEREIERVGGHRTIKVDVRVVAATNLDLQEEVRAGRFRADLFFRLNVFPIMVPPLRERLEDIPVFMNHFLRKFCALHERKVLGFTARAIDAMLNYDWPGNIRELENVVERGVIMAPDDGAIDSVHLFGGGERVEQRYLAVGAGGALGRMPTTAGAAPAAEADASRVHRKVTQLLAGIVDDRDTTTLDDIEEALIDKALQLSGGNLSAAARTLGMTRPQLAYRQKVRRGEGSDGGV
ncbi:sigma 54-interacting transcriptional regulator [Hydrocarboniphaga effusa]|uniref:sigma 54-interacting transcriptional regulator n=1 Tax=Hydrocarboniphaga effusa TaxID=243629 RepID=UPI00398BBDED